MSDSHDPLEVFREEARELLQEFEDSVIGLGEDPGDRELVNAAFRALHTIKGSGAMFELEELAAFAHDLETAFVELRDSGAAVSQRIVDLALSATDFLAVLIDGGIPDDTLRASGRAIVAELHGITGVHGDPPEGGGPGNESPVPPDAADAPRAVRGRYEPSSATFLVGTNPIALISELRELGDLTLMGDVTRVPEWEDFDPESCYMRWDFELETDRSEQDIRDVFMFIDADSVLALDGEDVGTAPSTGTSAASPPAIEAATPPAAPSDTAGTPATTSAVEGGGGATIKVRTDRLDRLVNLVGEMVSLQAQITLRATQLDDRLMQAHAEQLERLVRDARSLSMEMHMVPIERLFAPFRRTVRSLAAELGREAALEISGADTELDRNVVEQLRDPLLHIVRNAIDHGIESPEQRRAAGKAPVGRLRLMADYTGAMVRIRVQDDGAGLDAERIRARAVDRGIVDADETLTRDEVFRLIFAPGFSTAETATAVSGRGVGMDVVRRNIEALSGAVAVHSEPGAGTTVEMRIPLTLAIVEGLLAEVGDRLFLIKLEYIRECVDGAAATRGGQTGMIDFRGEVVPTLDLARYFGIGESEPDAPIIVIDASDRRLGLVVTRLLGNHQSVVKSLGKLLSGVEGISGVVFLSDGTPGLMLDVERVVRSSDRHPHH